MNKFPDSMRPKEFQKYYIELRAFGKKAWEMLKGHSIYHDSDEATPDFPICVECDEEISDGSHKPDCPLKALLDEGKKLYGEDGHPWMCNCQACIDKRKDEVG